GASPGQSLFCEDPASILRGWRWRPRCSGNLLPKAAETPRGNGCCLLSLDGTQLEWFPSRCPASVMFFSGAEAKVIGPAYRTAEAVRFHGAAISIGLIARLKPCASTVLQSASGLSHGRSRALPRWCNQHRAYRTAEAVRFHGGAARMFSIVRG